MPEPRRRLTDEELRRCVEPDTVIALVRVENVQVHGPGTPSERVEAMLAVDYILVGMQPPRVVAWRSGKNEPPLVEGHKYLMVLPMVLGYAPYGLGDFVEVLPGQEDSVVVIHTQALAALRTPGTPGSTAPAH